MTPRFFPLSREVIRHTRDTDISQTRRALGIVQTDNTPADLIVVDEINRLPIGRSWVTIILDVAWRAAPSWGFMRLWRRLQQLLPPWRSA
jgi:hypothetical protein